MEEILGGHGLAVNLGALAFTAFWAVKLFVMVRGGGAGGADHLRRQIAEDLADQLQHFAESTELRFRKVIREELRG